jgi:hypothetical protein
MALAASLPAKPRAAVPRVAFPEPPELAATQEALEARIDVDLAGVSLAGAVASVFRLLEEPRLNHCVRVTGGVLADACGAILSDVFRGERGEAADEGKGPEA